jgi:hypothetical protein
MPSEVCQVDLTGVGRGRSKWQDGRRAWERLNYWYRGIVDRFPAEHPDRERVGRAAAGALTDIAFVRKLLDDLELRLVRTAREGGVSWTEIATPLGISRQAAWEKWRDLDEGANIERKDHP